MESVAHFENIFREALESVLLGMDCADLKKIHWLVWDTDCCEEESADFAEAA